MFQHIASHQSLKGFDLDTTTITDKKLKENFEKLKKLDDSKPGATYAGFQKCNKIFACETKNQFEKIGLQSNDIFPVKKTSYT